MCGRGPNRSPLRRTNRAMGPYRSARTAHGSSPRAWTVRQRCGTPKPEPNCLPLKGHTKWVTSVAFSANGSWIVTGSLDNTAKIWDAKTGTEVRTLNGYTGIVNAASFSPDGKRIVTGSADHMVKLWDITTGVEVLTLKGHTGAVTSVSFSLDGSQIVSTSWDGTTKVWDSRPFRDSRPNPR
uniref:WD-repeat protein n=1 Tax=Gemmata sp. Wa1-1 TaxID=235140 RepID=Q5EUH5_9BACT|nr:WD-repeat protein [Gemmata sp. Wa1-1]